MVTGIVIGIGIGVLVAGWLWACRPGGPGLHTPRWRDE